MNALEFSENEIAFQCDLTAFVREVVLPGSSNVTPKINPLSCFFKLEYRPSPIHRWGIFPVENIPARRKVIEYTGQKIDAQEVWRRRIREHLYLFQLNKTYAVDGAIGGSGAEFINHSCQPNLYSQIKSGRIYFVSNRQIAADEELTVFYNIVSDTDLPCSCGAENCRRVINQKRADIIKKRI